MNSRDLNLSRSRKNTGIFAGYQNFLLKTKELLLQAEHEVYMNTCFDLRIFAEELEELRETRGTSYCVYVGGRN